MAAGQTPSEGRSNGDDDDNEGQKSEHTTPLLFLLFGPHFYRPLLADGRAEGRSTHSCAHAYGKAT